MWLLIPILSVFATPAFADPTPNFDLVAEKLGLDDAQQSKVSEILYEHELERIDLKSAVERAEVELRHLLDADTPDRKKALAAVDTLNQAEAALRRHQVEMVLDLRGVVSAEQWDTLERLRQAKERMEKGWAPPAPPSPPSPPAVAPAPR
jgi:Spy/CpxP family protein refolding chaperone